MHPTSFKRIHLKKKIIKNCLFFFLCTHYFNYAKFDILMKPLKVLSCSQAEYLEIPRTRFDPEIWCRNRIEIPLTIGPDTEMVTARAERIDAYLGQVLFVFMADMFLFLLFAFNRLQVGKIGARETQPTFRGIVAERAGRKLNTVLMPTRKLDTGIYMDPGRAWSRFDRHSWPWQSNV